MTEGDEQERKNLNRKKTYILNKIIFPAMANLTVFLEYIAKNHELQTVFYDDLKDLFFGMLDNNPRGKIPVFRRFILSAVTWNYKKEKGQNNFRVELLHIMQRVIYDQLINIAMYELSPNVSSILIENDLGRAYTWTELLAANVKLKEAIETSKRKVLF